MTKLRTVQTNFNAGEMSLQKQSRIDTDAYHNGAALARNVRLLPQGGAKRRPGTRLAAQLQVRNYQLEEFTFDVNQAYIAMFYANAVDMFYDDGTFIASYGANWGAATIGQLSVAHQGDTMIVAHESFAPQTIKRIASNAFELGLYAFEPAIGLHNAPAQPYYRFLPPTATMTILFVSYSNGDTVFNWPLGYNQGTIIDLVCSQAFFTAAYVGTYLKIANAYVQINSVSDATHARCTLQSPSLYVALPSNPISLVNGNVFAKVSDPFHGYVVGTNVQIANALGVGNLLSTEINGQKAVTQYSTLHWGFNLPKPATESVVGGGDGVRTWGNAMSTRDWQEQAFSASRGWPRTVTFDDQRLVFGGTTLLPNRLMESQTDAPFNFDLGTGRDNESIQAGIGSEKVAIINAVVGFRHLQIFTSEGEFICPGSDNKPLTPGTISFKRQTPYGNRRIPPCEFDGSTLFVTKTGAIREMLFDSNAEAYGAPSLSFMAQHMISNPVRLESQIEGSGEQETLAFVVNADGGLAVLTFNRKEKVLGWAYWTTQGQFKDIVSVNRRLYAVVYRNLGGGERMFLEEFNDAYMLDCCVEGYYPGGGSSTVWGGHPYWDGTNVNILSGWWEDLGTAPCNGGVVVTPKPISWASMGYGFDFTLQTLPPELNLQDGPTVGQMRSVVRVRLEVDNTTTATVDGTHIQIKRIEDVNNPPAPVYGGLEFWPGGWDDKGQVTITCKEQGPITVKSVLLELEF